MEKQGKHLDHLENMLTYKQIYCTLKCPMIHPEKIMNILRMYNWIHISVKIL